MYSDFVVSDGYKGDQTTQGTNIKEGEIERLLVRDLTVWRVMENDLKSVLGTVELVD